VGENDRRLSILTQELGRLDVLAKGARKAGSRLAAVSEPMSVATLQLARGRIGTYVTQAQLQRGVPGIRRSYLAMLAGLAVCEAYAAVLPAGHEAPGAYETVVEALQAIDGSRDPVAAYVWAALKLLEREGAMPRFDACAVTGQVVRGAQRWISARAGGVVHESVADQFADRFRVSSEALIGLAKTAELDVAPNRLRRGSECARILHSFIRYLVERRLPATEALLAADIETGRV
jgi:DNA repair protein RecO (recombination protein O)